MQEREPRRQQVRNQRVVRNVTSSSNVMFAVVIGTVVGSFPQMYYVYDATTRTTSCVNAQQIFEVAQRENVRIVNVVRCRNGEMQIKKNPTGNLAGLLKLSLERGLNGGYVIGCSLFRGHACLFKVPLSLPNGYSSIRLEYFYQRNDSMRALLVVELMSNYNLPSVHVYIYVPYQNLAQAQVLRVSNTITKEELRMCE